MSKQKTAEAASSWQGFVAELVQLGVYKRSQGKVTRQVTFAALAGIVVLSAWTLYTTMQTSTSSVLLRAGAPLLLLGGGLWLAYRLVNTSRFAEFLINVEAEMTKVSWPTRGELQRSAAVVIFVMFALAFLLFFYDLLWRTLFAAIGLTG